MNAFWKLTFVEFKLFLRNYIATFFTLAFPLLMLVLFGSIYGNEPSSSMGGRGSMDVTIPGYIASLIIGTTAFLSLPMDLASQRQLGVLRRMRATPLHPGWVMAAKVATNLIVSLIGTGLLIVAGILLYHITLPAQWPLILAGMVFCSLSMDAVGMTIASLVRTANAVRVVSFTVFYPMMFLSGGTMPSQFLPGWVNSLAKAMPMTYSVNLLQKLWFGEGLDLTAALALLGFIVVGAYLAIRFFKWE